MREGVGVRGDGYTGREALGIGEFKVEVPPK